MSLNFPKVNEGSESELEPSISQNSEIQPESLEENDADTPFRIDSLSDLISKKTQSLIDERLLRRSKGGSEVKKAPVLNFNAAYSTAVSKSQTVSQSLLSSARSLSDSEIFDPLLDDNNNPSPFLTHITEEVSLDVLVIQAMITYLDSLIKNELFDSGTCNFITDRINVCQSSIEERMFFSRIKNLYLERNNGEEKLNSNLHHKNEIWAKKGELNATSYLALVETDIKQLPLAA